MTEENGLSFGDIFQAVRKKFKFVLLATVILAALFCVAVEFLYNPLASTYEISFVLSYPGSEAQKYPDGAPFYYRDMISEETLYAIQRGDGDPDRADDRLQSVDVKALCEGDGITITAAYEETGGVMRQTGRYTLSVKSSYFRNRDTAQAFLYAVARHPRKLFIERAKNIDYALDAATFENADFSGKIALLAQQQENILGQYDEWIKLYRASYTVAGKTLANHRAEAAIAFPETLQASLLEELETNGYVPQAELEARKAALKKEKEDNEKIIEQLREAYRGGTNPSIAASTIEQSQPLDLSEMLASLYARNVQIDSQIAALTEENVAAFEAQLKDVFDKMNTDQKASDGTTEKRSTAAIVSTVAEGLYENESRVIFDTTQLLRRGEIGLALNIVCGLLFGFLISCIGACIAGLPRRGKRSEAPAEGTEEGKEQTDGTLPDAEKPESAEAE